MAHKNSQSPTQNSNYIFLVAENIAIVYHICHVNTTSEFSRKIWIKKPKNGTLLVKKVDILFKFTKTGSNQELHCICMDMVSKNKQTAEKIKQWKKYQMGSWKLIWLVLEFEMYICKEKNDINPGKIWRKAQLPDLCRKLSKYDLSQNRYNLSSTSQKNGKNRKTTNCCWWVFCCWTL